MEKEIQSAPLRLIGIGEVAAMLGYTKPTVRGLTELKDDPLPCTRLPGSHTQRRFKRGEVEAWIARNVNAKGGRADG